MVTSTCSAGPRPWGLPDCGPVHGPVQLAGKAEKKLLHLRRAQSHAGSHPLCGPGDSRGKLGSEKKPTWKNTMQISLSSATTGKERSTSSGISAKLSTSPVPRRSPPPKSKQSFTPDWQLPENGPRQLFSGPESAHPSRISLAHRAHCKPYAQAQYHQLKDHTSDG